MIQSSTRAGITKKLKTYRRLYLRQYSNLSESRTRVIVNHLLSDVLGYRELDEVVIEHRIGSTFVDYMIMVAGNPIFIVEVKPLRAKLSPRHIEQGLIYGLKQGVNWAIITNADELVLYRISYSKPIKITRVAGVSLLKLDRRASYLIQLLSRNAVLGGELDEAWYKYRSLAKTVKAYK